MKSKSLIGFVIVVAALIVSAEVAPCYGQKLTKEEKEELKDLIKTRFFRNIDIAGVIKDRETGKILKNAEVRVLVIDRKGKWRKEIPTEEGRFKLQYPKVQSFTVWFDCPGYYDERMWMAADWLLPITGVSEDGIPIVGDKEMTVELIKTGPLTDMIERAEHLQEIGRRDARSILSPLRLLDDGSFVKVSEWQDLSDLPPGTFYFRVERDEQGNAVRGTEPVSRYTNGHDFVDDVAGDHYAGKAYLGVTGEGNGLMVYKPADAGKHIEPKRAMRLMQVAPEYKQEILIDQKSRYGFYFYVKLGKFYGKGYVKTGSPVYIRENERWPDPDKEGSTLEAVKSIRVKVYMQPNGSRNVRTRD